MANVSFRRGTQEYINNNVPISDGQIVFNETDQAIYVDTPVNNTITRLRYGGGNLSRSDIDMALSDTSENPVANKVITNAIGNLSDLTTDAKTSVVAAINEVRGVTRDNVSAITALQTLTKMLSATGASRANSFIYEYNLGTSFTNEQSADIVSGTFDKVRPGGYWTINGRKYWAAHADYRLHCGDTELTKHHMLVFPDKSFYNHAMNSTPVTTGGYYGSDMVSKGLTQALATVKADFGESHILTYRNMLANAAGDSSTNWAWYDRQIDLMNQSMVYGHVIWPGNGFDVGCDKTQIALFQARPDLIVNRENWWLRDVRSSAYFCHVNAGGYAIAWSASSVFGVRPAFLIA